MKYVLKETSLSFEIDKDYASFIEEWLGQSRFETTENYYITSTTNDLIKICESIEKEIDINFRYKF